VRNGEGVYGLRRALVLAGSRTQVMSLWKVSDTATKELMMAYYARLQKGEGRSAALCAVQNDMLAGTEWTHPYYWAAFIVSGEGGPLP
jgi:CHAT domain-containing protein